MSLLQHNKSSCKTLTTPIWCWDCGTAVFYLRCTCGSKVLFKELGGSWDKHDCRSRVGRRTGAIRIVLQSYDPRILEWAIMRIAEVATSTGAGMRVPPLATTTVFRLLKKPRRYSITLTNPTDKTMAVLSDCNLPIGVDFHIEPIQGGDNGDVGRAAQKRKYDALKDMCPRVRRAAMKAQNLQGSADE